MYQQKSICTNIGYFSQEVAADTRRKEFNIKNYSVVRSKQQPDFLFIGDSITQYWELNAYFHNTNQLIINRGIAGDTTTYLKKRLYADALQLNPKYIILNIGINDTEDLEGDYWKQIPPKPYDLVLERAKRNIIDIIQQTKKTSSTIILTSLLPIKIDISLHETERKRFIYDFNLWLANISKKENLIFVNYFISAVYPGTNRLLENVTYDGLHPNARGYELMSKVLKTTLNKNKIKI